MFNITRVRFKSSPFDWMPTIKRIAATTEQVETARKSAFTAGYGFNDGQILTVKEVGFTAHSIDGKSGQNACPVIFLQNTEEVVYLRALLKERYDYKGAQVPVTGTLNLFVRSLSGKTLGEVIDTLNARIGNKTIRALRRTFQGVNRQGDVQPISYNEYDLV